MLLFNTYFLLTWIVYISPKKVFFGGCDWNNFLENDIDFPWVVKINFGLNNYFTSFYYGHIILYFTKKDYVRNKGLHDKVSPESKKDEDHLDRSTSQLGCLGCFPFERQAM